MVETIKLLNPVMIDNEPVRQLTYDIDAISSDQFIRAEILAADAAMREHKTMAKVVELDAGFHIYLGVMAVLAANPGYAVEDVMRIKGPDLRKVMNVGRNFMIAGAEEDEDGASASSEEPEEEAAGEDETSYLPVLE